MVLRRHQIQLGSLGAKPPEIPEILYFVVPENALKIHIFPVCCSAKTQDKLKLQPSAYEESVRLILDLTRTWKKHTIKTAGKNNLN